MKRKSRYDPNLSLILASELTNEFKTETTGMITALRRVAFPYRPFQCGNGADPIEFTVLINPHNLEIATNRITDTDAAIGDREIKTISRESLTADKNAD